MKERLTREECQAIIDGNYEWEDSYIIDTHGNRREDSPYHRTFKQANIVYWGNHYPAILKERLTKYEEGTFCRRHRDNGWRMIKEGYCSEYVWITPLNDDYEGGDLYFDDKIVEQRVGVPIKMLRMIPHEITEITKGTRYSLVSWTFKNIFDNSR